MKKFIMILFAVAYLPLFLLYLFSRVDETKVCDVLPAGINYKLVLGSALFDLTEHGLVAKGQYVNFDTWKGRVVGPILDNNAKLIYFYVHDAFDDSISDGIYKLDLGDPASGPKFVSKTENSINPTVSPDGKYLTFYQNVQTLEEKQKQGWLYNFMLLNLKTKELRKLEDSTYSYHDKPSWINNRQLVYHSCEDNTLFLFDVDKDGKQDLQIHDSVPGSLTLDKKHLLLSKDRSTEFFNVDTKKIDKVINQVISSRVIWMPDGKGYIFQNRTWADIFSIPIRELGGTSYYSLETRRNVRLIDGVFDGGFIIPPEIDIKDVGSSRSRHWAEVYNGPDELKKVCCVKEKTKRLIDLR